MSKKKAKIPKHVAGFKIPKKIRRDYKPLLKLLSRPEVQAFVSAALTAGATALAEQTNGAGRGRWKPKKVMRRLKFFAADDDGVTEVAQSVGRAVGGAVATLLPDTKQHEKPPPLTH